MSVATRALPALSVVVLCLAPAVAAAASAQADFDDALARLVKEYDEYVMDGQVIDQEKYEGEVLGIYLPYMQQSWTALRPGVVARSGSAEAEHLDADVARIDARVRAPAPNAEVEALVLDLRTDVERLLGAPVVAGSPTGAAEALQATEARVGEAVEAYGRGEQEEALSLLASAYVELYAPGAEAAVPSALNDRIEQLMNIALRAQMRSGAPVEEVRETQSELRVAFAQAQAALATPATDAGIFANAFVLIAREGFEAALVLAAVVGYLVRSGHKDKTRQVYVGAGLAVAASLVLWALVSTVFAISGTSRELLEGVTALLAVAVLFYVSYWLIDKVQIKRWNRFIQGKVRSALSGGRAYALVSVAFLAVFREGLETVLFFQALLGSAAGPSASLSALAGFLIGFAVLVAVFVAFTKYGVAIPMRPFFILTSAMLYYLAFAFMGAGVHELQEAGAVGITPLAGLQGAMDGSTTLSSVAGFLGFHATAETIAAQTLLLVAALGGLVYSFVILPRREAEVLPVGTVEV
jgi:high-affinity iron transporter